MQSVPVTSLADHLAPVILIFHRGEQLISSHVALALVLEGSFAPSRACALLCYCDCLAYWERGVVKSFLDTPKARGMKCLHIQHESRNNGSTANQRLLPASFLWGHRAAIVTEHEEKQQSAFPFSPPLPQARLRRAKVLIALHIRHISWNRTFPLMLRGVLREAHHSTTLISPLLSVIYR